MPLFIYFMLKIDIQTTAFYLKKKKKFKNVHKFFSLLYSYVAHRWGGLFSFSISVIHSLFCIFYSFLPLINVQLLPGSNCFAIIISNLEVNFTKRRYFCVRACVFVYAFLMIYVPLFRLLICKMLWSFVYSLLNQCIICIEMYASARSRVCVRARIKSKIMNRNVHIGVGWWLVCKDGKMRKRVNHLEQCMP